MAEESKERGVKLIHKIACEVGMTIIALICAIACFCNGRGGLMLAIFGGVTGFLAGQDIVRYKNGVRIVSQSEMGRRSPAWVRYIIVGVALAVFAFVVYLFMNDFDLSGSYK